jgi:vacuolar protein sorting-associated protein 41
MTEASPELGDHEAKQADDPTSAADTTVVETAEPSAVATDKGKQPESTSAQGDPPRAADTSDDQDADDGDGDEEEDDDGDEEEDEEDEEPRLKYARLTQNLGAVYRNGDATSAFLVAGDKMVC